MNDTRNITVRFHEAHFALVQRAAKKKGLTVSDYVRDVVVPLAGRDVGEVPAELPKLMRGRRASEKAQASAALGIDPRFFAKFATQLAIDMANNPEYRAALQATQAKSSSASGTRSSAKMRAATAYSEQPAPPRKRH